MNETRLFRAPLVVLDTETTGMPRDPWASVVELGAVLLNEDGKEVDHWNELVYAVLDERCEPALRVNQIPREDIEAARTADVVAEAFLDWWRFNGCPYVTSFNVGFDRPMVERMGLRNLRWASCVMLRATAVMDEADAVQRWDNGEAKWARLAEAAEFFSVAVIGEAHRAETDARTAAGIAVAIRRRENP